jgi:protein-export membrane protein SecD
MISQQGLVTFHMVREISAEEAEVGLLPVGAMLVQPLLDGTQPEVVTRRPEFTGARLVRANPSTDAQTGEFVLSFQFDQEGARRFCRITTEHTGQRFAILFDNRVMTAPRINEPICAGSGQISGNFTAESASELATIMRAGALPAPFRIVEERAPAP